MHFIYEVADKDTGDESLAFINAADEEDAESRLDRKGFHIARLARAVYSTHGTPWRILGAVLAIAKQFSLLMIVVSLGVGVMLFYQMLDHNNFMAVVTLIGAISSAAFWIFCFALLLAVEWLCFYAAFQLPPSPNQDA